MESAELSTELLSLAYTAATDHAKWQAFCDELNAITTVPIMMFGHNIKDDESLGIIASGLDPAEVKRYHCDYADRNPWMHMDVVMPMGAVGTSDQALPRKDLFKTEFYNDWLRLQENIVAGPCMMCYRSADRFVAMAVACRERDIDRTLSLSHRLLSSLAPHVARSMQMAAVLSNGSVTSFAHLEASRQAIVVLRRSGRVGFVNAAARHFMSGTRPVLKTQARKLIANDERLRDYLAAALEAFSSVAFETLPSPLVLQTSDFGPCVFYTHALPPAVAYGFPGSAWADPPAGALVVTGQFGLEGPDTFDQLALAFGATPAEARLAQALCEGLSLSEYADLHNLSRHTVRNQLRRLLQKTDTHSQSDFVRRMFRLLSPFEDAGQ